MSAFPLPVSGYPNLATTQMLMTAAGGLGLPGGPSVSSAKDLPACSPGGQLAGNPASLAAARLGALPGLGDLTAGGAGGPGHGYLPAHFMAMAGMADPRILYSALGGGYEIKDNSETLLAWRHLAAQAQAASSGMLPYDSHAAAMAAAASFPYPGYPSMDLNGVRRKNATRETTSTLKAWLYEHRKNPYPTKGEKIMLAIITKMTLTQVSTWFANARRRLKKENKMTWSPRNRAEDGSDDGDDKVDDDDADDVSIDLSDFEADNPSVSPQKNLSLTRSSESDLVAQQSAVISQSSHNSVTSPSNKDNNKPRIWSIADVAASKSSTNTPIHHQTTSVRHKPYPMPIGSAGAAGVAAFRPWFENSYRSLAGHPLLGNHLLNRPSMDPTNIRLPPPSQPSASSSSSTDSRRIPSGTSSPEHKPTSGGNVVEITVDRQLQRHKSLSPASEASPSSGRSSSSSHH